MYQIFLLPLRIEIVFVSFMYQIALLALCIKLLCNLYVSNGGQIYRVA